jgi:PDZ domain-containing protein
VTSDLGPYFDEPSARPPKKRRWLGFTFIAIFVAGVVTATYLPAPYVIESPGPAFNVLGTDNKEPIISVSGAKTYPTSGSLDLLTVNVLGSPGATPTWLELFAAWLDPSAVVEPLEAVFPSQQSVEDVTRQNELMFADSQQQATAAALRALGYQYTYQVFVDRIPEGTASSGILKAGDLIDKVAGKPVNGITSLRAAVQTTKGQPLVVSGSRNGNPLSVTIQPKLISGVYKIGAYIGTKFVFPIDVKLRLADVGGPSGGTMFALGIYDTLTPGSLTGGQMIAGTGTIDESGQVGPIGGIRQKLYGAQRAGAAWFLAPAVNCSEVVGHVPAGLQVVSVKTFSDALAAVKQIAAKHSVAGLATCSAK